MSWAPRSLEFFTKSAKGGRILVVSVNVAEQATKLLKGRGIHPAMFFEAVVSAGPELIECPARFGDADDRHTEVATLQHRLQRGKDLLIG